MSMNNIECDSCLDPKFNTKCPPRMADGRAFTDYRPRCMLHNTKAPTDSYKQRMYLTQNATDIMKTNMMDAFNNNSCEQKQPTNTVLPHAFKQDCDVNTCRFMRVDPNGVGLM